MRTTATDRADLVIVGGGIAGAGLATVLARHGPVQTHHTKDM